MTDNVPVPASPKKQGFIKGQSGNPAGRPKGSKNKITLMKLALEGELRTSLRGHAQEILDVAITLAKSGDTSMLKLLIDKMIPTSKALEDEIPQKEQINIAITRLPDEGVVINQTKVIEHDRQEASSDR
jgi:hypothetical protein